MGLNGNLSPEQQSGVEVGADFFIGSLAALHVTRFDQHASGLIQPVSIYKSPSADSLPHYRRIVYELQNVGEITNRGWELQGSVGSGPWSLGAMFSQVDSRVRKLAEQYTGDLRPGDRMLEVPARTFGVNASYTHSRVSMSWRVSRASDWINYDRLALLSAFASETDRPTHFHRIRPPDILAHIRRRHTARRKNWNRRCARHDIHARWREPARRAAGRARQRHGSSGQSTQRGAAPQLLITASRRRRDSSRRACRRACSTPTRSSFRPG